MVQSLSRLVVALAAATMVGATMAATPAIAEAGTLVDIGPWGEDGGELVAGQFEIRVLSTRASLVTNGDALVGIIGLAEDDAIQADVDGRDITNVFVRRDDGRWVGLVDGLRVGDSNLRVTAFGSSHGTRRAVLPITNHPVTGPIISGPHQDPFACRTNDSGLGDPIDDDCSIRPRVDWFYKSTDDSLYKPLEDPFGDYPDDLATTTTLEGRTVPAIVRLESRTINRSITRIALLDDPIARGPDRPFDPHEQWNEKLLYHYGASCGIGHHQGMNVPGAVLSGFVDVGGSTPEFPDFQVAGLPFTGIPTAVGLGYLAVHSTLTMFTNSCNSVLSAETVMMVKEHIIEQYGEPTFTFSMGASGGAIQQTTIADNFPGLIEGISPMVPFPDVATTAMSPLDCRLLNRVFGSDPITWNEAAKQAVTGHATSRLCVDWEDLFADVVVADRGCGRIPDDRRYHPTDNPNGTRCTVQDQLRNILGLVEGTNRAEIPFDNRGVQYGLEALNAGLISPDAFVALNAQAGGYDQDGHVTDTRSEMTDDLVEHLYDIGAVVGRGGINTVPMVQLNTYVDLVPILDFHDQVRSYQIRARMEETFGTADSQVMWNGAHLPAEAWAALDAWLTNIENGDRSLPRDEEVLAARPATVNDECGAVAGVTPVGDPDGLVCENVVAIPRDSPRMVAGGPDLEDILKCQLKPIDPADYTHPLFNAGHVAALGAVFPDGVCDWSKPGVGEDQPRSRTWLSAGTGPEILAEPVEIPNLVARSTLVTAQQEVEPVNVPLPTTGGGLALVALAAAMVGSRRRPRA